MAGQVEGKINGLSPISASEKGQFGMRLIKFHWQQTFFPAIGSLLFAKMLFWV
jgi:hypothetical protein